MAITLKEESILNQRSQMVDHAAGRGDTVLEAIQQQLEDAEIPGGCTWSMQEVKSSGFFSKTQREFLIVNHEAFSDYHLYLCIRDYEVHLHCSWFLTVEPGFLKKWASEKLTGFGEMLSAPRNIMVHQDLQAWVSVVHQTVLSAVQKVMSNMGQNTSHLHRGSKGFLEFW